MGMNKSGLVAASMAAASVTAISVSSSSRFVNQSKIHHSHQESATDKMVEKSSSQRSNSNDKFAPRFDGLRFIETLVTAHR